MASRVSDLRGPLLLGGGGASAFLLLSYALYERQGYSGFVLPLLVLGALAVAYLACQVDPAWSFSAAILAFVFNGNWSQFHLPSLIAPDRFLIVLAILALLAGPAARYRPALRVEPIHKLLGLVVLYAGVSAVLAGSLLTEEAGYRLLDRLGILPFLLFLLAPLAFRSARQRSILLASLVGLGAYLGLTSLFETIGPHALVFPRYILDQGVGIQAGHARGPFVEAEANGVALFGCGVACAMAVALWRARSARLLAGAIAFICGLDCLFTLQRAVWIGAVVGIVLTMAAFAPLRRYLLPTLAALALGVALSLSLIPGLSTTASERANDQMSVWDRENLSDAAFRMIAARPLLGFGWGTFTHVAEPYFRQRDDIPLTASNGPKGTDIQHSVLLSNAVELGLLGSTLWLLAIVLAVGGAIVTRGPPELLPWRMGLLAFTCCWAVVLNLTPLPQAFPNLLLWLWAGVVVSWRYAPLRALAIADPGFGPVHHGPNRDAARTGPPSVVVSERGVVAGALAVTVVIPAYNRAALLGRALQSVQAQRPLPPAEVIVVDDGSDDETAGVARSFGAKVLTHDHNRGLSAARNSGLEAATQPWIALLDSDDEWLSHHLEQLWSLRGDHVLVAASSLRCGPDPATARFHGPVCRKPAILRSGERLVYPGNPIPVSAAMIRRDAAISAGGFQPRRGLVEDMDLWLRLLERGSALCTPRVGVIYHVHDGQMSLQDSRAMQLAHIEAAEAHRLRTRGSRAPIERWEGVAAWDNLRDALALAQPGTAGRWALYVAARPRRLTGLLGILIWRYFVRRRSRALSAIASARHNGAGV